MTENLRGIGLMTASMALFAAEDLFLKLAAGSLPLGQILFVSGAFAVPVFWLLARRDGAGLITHDALHPAVLWRNAGEIVAAYAYIAALASVPLSTVAAALQATPLAVTLGAALFLRETVGWRRWAAILAGFAGVILVVQPGAEGFQAATLWVLVSVAGVALRDLMTRRIPPGVGTHQIAGWGLASVAVLGAAMMAATGEARMPDMAEIGTLGGALLFGSAGYAAVTAASRTGEVSVVAPFRYSRLVFSMAVGVTFFSERPDALTLAGAAIIIVSGLYAFWRERARKRALPTPASAG